MWFKKREPKNHEMKIELDAAKFEYMDCVRRMQAVPLHKGDRVHVTFDFNMRLFAPVDFMANSALLSTEAMVEADRDMTLNFMRICSFQYEAAVYLYETFPTEVGGTFPAKPLTHI